MTSQHLLHTCQLRALQSYSLQYIHIDIFGGIQELQFTYSSKSIGAGHRTPKCVLKYCLPLGEWLAGCGLGLFYVCVKTRPLCIDLNQRSKRPTDTPLFIIKIEFVFPRPPCLDVSTCTLRGQPGRGNRADLGFSQD